MTSVNQTTNEAGKWSDINRWYKQEKKKYENAVKKGLVKPKESSAKTTEGPPVQDGDVTCTGASKQQSEQEKEPPQEEQYFDPGPVPKNLYDRGFIENWKEVLFPLSLRDNFLELGGYSRTKRPPGDSRPSSAQPGRGPPKSSPQPSATNKSKST